MGPEAGGGGGGGGGGGRAGVAIGSEMSGGIQNVTVTKSRFISNGGLPRQSSGAHIKTAQSRGGFVIGVHFSDLVAEVQKTPCLSHLFLHLCKKHKTINLPRQARDKLRKVEGKGGFRQGDLKAGVLVDDFYGAPNPSCPTGWKPPAPPILRDFTFERINGTSGTYPVLRLTHNLS